MAEGKLSDRVSAIIIKNKKLLLVTGYLETLYWTPGGKIEPKENHKETLKRELSEELGVVLNKADFFLSYESRNEIVNKKQKVYCYLVGFVGKIICKGEVTKFVWCSREELKKINVVKSITDNLLPNLIKDKLI